jgi:hypothetical protein
MKLNLILIDIYFNQYIFSIWCPLCFKDCFYFGDDSHDLRYFVVEEIQFEFCKKDGLKYSLLIKFIFYVFEKDILHCLELTITRYGNGSSSFQYKNINHDWIQKNRP